MPHPVPLRTPVQTRAQKTRKALVDAARKEFSKHGYALTTAKSIAERAGVGTGTFYHYFPDKDSVLREIAAERVEQLLVETAPLSAAPLTTSDLNELLANATWRVRKLVELYVQYHRADRGLHAVIMERRLCEPELERIMSVSEREAVRRIEGALVLWQYEGDCEAAAYMMFSLLEGAVHGHVLTHAMLPEKRFLDGLADALLRVGMPAALIREQNAVLPEVSKNCEKDRHGSVQYRAKQDFD